MLVEYVGKKPYHSDRFFGSGQSWDGAGDVKEVDEATAKRMCSLFPSLYVHSTGTETGLHTADALTLRDQADVPKAVIDLHEIAESDGRMVTLRQASRLALLEHAKTTLGIQTPAATTKVDLLAMIVGYLELGPKSAAETGAAAKAAEDAETTKTAEELKAAEDAKAVEAKAAEDAKAAEEAQAAAVAEAAEGDKTDPPLQF